MVWHVEAKDLVLRVLRKQRVQEPGLHGHQLESHTRNFVLTEFLPGYSLVLMGNLGTNNLAKIILQRERGRGNWLLELWDLK